MCLNSYIKMYSLNGLHGNMNAAPVFSKKKKTTPEPNLTLKHSNSWKGKKNADKENSERSSFSFCDYCNLLSENKTSLWNCEFCVTST